MRSALLHYPLIYVVAALVTLVALAAIPVAKSRALALGAVTGAITGTVLLVAALFSLTGAGGTTWRQVAVCEVAGGLITATQRTRTQSELVSVSSYLTCRRGTLTISPRCRRCGASWSWARDRSRPIRRGPRRGCPVLGGRLAPGEPRGPLAIQLRLLRVEPQLEASSRGWHRAARFVPSLRSTPARRHTEAPDPALAQTSLRCPGRGRWRCCR